MISAFTFALLTQLPLGPIPQPGGNRLHHELVDNVAEALRDGKWAEAEVAAKALPGKVISIEWNDKNVAPLQRPQYIEARDEFARDFAKQSVEWTVKFVAKGDIRISFEPEFPVGVNGTRPAAAWMFSPSPSEPKVDAVIALKRGQPLAPIEPDDVYNEVGFAVMQYLGKEPTPYPMDFSYRSEQPSRGRRKLSALERLFMQRTARNYASLNESIKLRRSIEPATPRMRVDVKAIEFQPVIQGDVREFSLQITNVGNAALMLQARPDCGCVSIEPAQTVDPGQTILMRGAIDTTEFVGPLDKKIFLTSNDGEKPFSAIPVRIFAKPLFRMVQPTGTTLISDGSAVQTSVYMFVDPSIKLAAKSVQTAGLPASAKLEPWTGSMADPEMNETAKPRKGYRIRVDVAKGMPPGRFPVSVIVNTDHPKYPQVRSSFYVQTGIIAQPSLVYLGEVKREARTASTFVSRPGKPFRIQRLVCSAPYLKATAFETKPGTEYRIQVQFDGTQPSGNLSDVVQVFTDDPKQPRLDITVSASVR